MSVVFNVSYLPKGYTNLVLDKASQVQGLSTGLIPLSSNYSKASSDHMSFRNRTTEDPTCLWRVTNSEGNKQCLFIKRCGWRQEGGNHLSSGFKKVAPAVVWRWTREGLEIRLSDQKWWRNMRQKGALVWNHCMISRDFSWRFQGPKWKIS